MPKLRRVRRSPEVARAHILNAATTVLARLGPDAAGLKDIAAEAEVSHGLVTHYFGTFDNLVDQVLASRMGPLRDELIAAFRPDEDLDVQALLQAALDRFVQPENGRLLAWAWLSGRMDHEDFHARRLRGLERISEAIAAATGAPRSTVDELLIVCWSTLASYSVAREVLWASMGQQHAAAHDQRIAARLAQMASLALAAGG